MARTLDYLYDPRLNKGTAFTEAEREALGLRGLLPPRVVAPEEQEARVLENFRRKSTDLERYIYLISLQDRNEHLFYRVLMEHIEEMLPIVYTPTVGEACLQFGHIFRRPRGLYLCPEDRGHVTDILRHWPEQEVGIIVVTDGERILGLGDLGANGMGIPIGKLALYTACAGVDPSLCLPLTLDTGTEREDLRADPLYLGRPVGRTRGQDYFDLVEEMITGVQEVFPDALIQFEDFATDNAQQILARYRDRVCCFNDDIQGTAAVTLAGLLSACRITGQPLTSQRLVFLGAGAAATGIADLFVAALVRGGVAVAEARQQVWFVDRDGLVTADRHDLTDFKRPYAHAAPPAGDLLAAVEAIRPTAIIGVSAQARGFTEPVVQAMSRINPRPVIFPLSNPTSRSECTAEQAYAWSGGTAIFASGSPFAPVTTDGRRFHPAQSNNAYIFPGLGLGVMLTGATRVTDAMFSAAAETLAGQVSDGALAEGRLFPPLSSIRDVSLAIGVEVARVAFAQGLARRSQPADLTGYLRQHMYDARYPEYR
jgi:malate dehydrogenase (oxaloacetate-decarboxylating)(NADP+)